MTPAKASSASGGGASGLRVEHFAGSDGRSRKAAALAACRAIRREVFIEGQGVPAELEWDGLDESAEHFLLYVDTHGPAPPGADPVEPARAVGTARLRCVDGVGKAERVAVRAARRGQGLGRALMEAVEAHARSRGLREIRLHAQLPVVRFYEALGYRAEGDVFDEAGLPHRAMSSRPLAPLPQARARDEAAQPRAGAAPSGASGTSR